MEQLLENGGDGYYEEKKSKFIARSYPVSDEEEVQTILAAVRKRYYDARHNCYAYRIGGQEKSSDDGEPSGTAGKPILEVIAGAGLTNVLVVVTRYFGGTLLGTGGLVRAYQSAAKDALMHSETVSIVPGERYCLTVEYSFVGKIQYLIANHPAVLIDTQYGSEVTFVVDIQQDGLSAFLKEATEQTAGKVVTKKVSDRMIKLPSCVGTEPS